jgi:hypothetical protein
MSRKFKFRNPDSLYFISYATVYWLDIFIRKAAEKNCNNVNFQFWQQQNKPIGLFNNKMIDQKLDYLHNNPVVEGIVDYPENYYIALQEIITEKEVY